MAEVNARCVSELRSELEASTARLRADLQEQLWNYYGSLRDPLFSLKERVEQVEDKLEDSKDGRPPETSFDLQANAYWRLSQLERQVAEPEAREAAWKEEAVALKNYMASMEATQSGAFRQLEVLQQAQNKLQNDVQLQLKTQAAIEASQSTTMRQLNGLQEAQKELQEQFSVRLERQELYLKDVQNDLKREVAHIGGLQEAVENTVRETLGFKEQMEQQTMSITAQQDLLKRHLEETGAALQHQGSSLAAAVKGLQEKMVPMHADVKSAEAKLEKGLDEMKLLQQSLRQQEERVSAIGSTVDALKSCKVELGEVGRKVFTLAQRTESLNEIVDQENEQTKEKLKWQQNSMTEQMEELKTRITQQFNGQLQQMQHDLQSFLRQQDTSLQEQVQRQLETQDAALQKLQTSLVTRMERCQAEALRKAEHRADETESKIRSLELQASAQGATEKRAVDLEKRLTQVTGDVRKLESKVEQKSRSFEDGFNLKSVEDKLSADLKAVKLGIDSIRDSVAGAGAAHASWCPSPPVPLWPTKSQPCSPASEPRTTGPLLRPCTMPWRAQVNPPVAAVTAPVAPVTAPVTAPVPAPVTLQAQAMRSLSPCRAAGCMHPRQEPSQQSQESSTAQTSESGSQVTSQDNSRRNSVESPFPVVLRIFCPATPGLPAIQGEYCLVPEKLPNGRPLWKQRNQELWLYYGTNSRWFVGGPDAKDWNFECEAGFIYSEPARDGATPDQSTGWARFQGGVFLADPRVSVVTASA